MIETKPQERYAPTLRMRESIGAHHKWDGNTFTTPSSQAYTNPHRRRIIHVPVYYHENPTDPYLQEIALQYAPRVFTISPAMPTSITRTSTDTERRQIASWSSRRDLLTVGTKSRYTCYHSQHCVSLSLRYLSNYPSQWSSMFRPLSLMHCFCL
jgi:hypothetical protein